MVTTGSKRSKVESWLVPAIRSVRSKLWRTCDCLGLLLLLVYDGMIVMTDYHEACVGCSEDCFQTVFEVARSHLGSALGDFS